MTLFRPEALQHRQGNWLGSIRLSQPVALRWITLGVVCSVMAVLAFLFWGEASRRAHLAGVLVPAQGLVRVASPRVAAVAAVAVTEGQSVRAGDLLLTLEWLDPQLNAGTQAELQATFDARLRSLDEASRRQAQLAAGQAQALSRRIDSLRLELQQAGEQLRWQAQRLALAEQAQTRWEQLAQQQFVSTAQAQVQMEALLAQRAEARSLARQRESLVGQLASLEAEQRALPLEAAQRQGELSRQREDVAEAMSRADAGATRRQWLIRAPVSGRVGAVHVMAGQAVPEGQGLVSLLPAAGADAPRLVAQLYAPSSALGFLAVGQSVQLRLQAYPFQKFGALPGQVTEVAQAPLPASELASLLPWVAASAAEPLYRIQVKLDRQVMPIGGELRPLLAGMQLDADVLLERRRLVEWLFEPLLGWRARQEQAP